MIQLAEKTLAELCLAASARYGNRTAFSLFAGGKVCRRVTYRMMGLRARQIGMLLGRLGVAPGNRVLLLSENRPEWPMAYFGIALAGAVSVPLLTGFSPDQARRIAGHAEVSAIILSRETAAKIGPPASSSSMPLIFIDSITEEGEIAVARNGLEQRMPLPASGEDFGKLPRQKPGDLASIIYTSGTLGNSKGVMLSSANLISCALSSLSLVKIFPRDRLLSVLPLAHAYECSLGLLAPLLSGASVSYLDRPPSPSALLPAAQALRPTAMVAVPVFIEKMYHSAVAPKLRASGLYRCRLTRPLAIRLAGRKLNKALGGRIRFFGIGGAPLAPEVEDFLRRANFPFAPGYGLTEAAPLAAGTAPRRFPRRSSGAAPDGVELRIAAGGEIQVRGSNVMMGYYRDEAQTREAFSGDGWLRTGDLGRIDGSGKLYVRGRIKALILGPCGENIYPEEIESLLSTSQLVEEALVYSGEKGELVALVRLNDAAKAAASAIERALEELRAWANKKLANFSRLSRIEVKYEPFEKTPTMKIKRYLYA
ncbi:MAG: AMP-binding protein [Treponema sp.]|jgi:long-chain acyl-CoA synthetase|nr:AMP-binding protein [Treponema sp.]